MNSPFLRWLLDLDAIPRDASELRLAWDAPLESWVWALVILAAALVALASYRRLIGRPSARIALAAVRFAVLLLAAVLLARPMIEMPREEVEPDAVIMLLDRSASMTLEDVTPPLNSPVDSARISRDDQLRAILDRNASALASIAEDRRIHWLGFHDGAFPLELAMEDDQSDAAALPILDEPAGRRTDLAAAIEQSLQRAAGRPVTAVLVFSDGRASEPIPRSLVRRLQAEGVEIFAVPLGSADPIGDLALRRVDAPRRSFIRDRVPVTVELDRFGASVRDLGATVRLIDELTGEVLAEAELPPGDERESITLIAEPKLAGETTWAVEAQPARADLVAENNRAAFDIELIDRPLRVLFVEGYPRWEYRYLKNLLIREETIESSVMLISADRDFAQEGNAPITRLPRTADELAPYDVLIIGDAPASFFSPDQLETMREHVALRGAGLLWIGGQRSTPDTYAGSPLADLLPFRAAGETERLDQPANMAPTPLARSLGILQMVTPEGPGWPESLADPSYGWSQLQWAQRIEPGRLKPSAEVLATTRDTFAAGAGRSEPLPLVMSLRYGAGMSIYVATDEIWRWRYGRGELYPDQFWIQIVRLLGRQSLSAGGEHVRLAVAPRRADVGQPVRISLTLLDEQLIERRRGSIQAELVRGEDHVVARLELRPQSDEGRTFAATIQMDQPGSFTVRIADPAFADDSPLELARRLDVYAPDDELRRPETDHALLARLAEQTGGAVVPPDEIADIQLRNRAVTTDRPLRESIWDTPLMFTLMLLLLAAEWIGRRFMQYA